jgi:hypothetical protein
MARKLDRVTEFEERKVHRLFWPFWLALGNSKRQRDGVVLEV